jgi:predicted PurR-regulated permease PerM
MDKERRSSHRVVKFGYYSFVVVVIIFVLFCFKLLFSAVLASVLLALLLSPLVNYLETLGLKRITVILGIYVVITLITVGSAVFLVPKLINEAQTFAQDLPLYKTKVENGITKFQQTLQKKFPEVDIPDMLAFVKARVSKHRGVNIEAVIAYLSSFFSILSLVVIVPIVTFFLLVDGHLINKALLRMVPNSYFEMTVLLFHKVTSALKLFIRGQLIDAAAVGVLTSIGLAIIGLPYFLVIGIIAGVGNLIPYLGPVIGFIPAISVAIMSPGGFTVWSVLSILIVFVIVQFVEGTFVYPIAVGKSVDLHPLIVIIGVTIGGQLGGVLGMLIAVPLISIVKVSFEVLYFYLKSYSII